MTATEATTLSSLCAACAREARASLAGPESLEDEEIVHRLRVATKRLRAAWRLASGIAGKDLSRARRDALRELSGLLSHARDRAVSLELARKLAENAPETAERTAFAALLDAFGPNRVESPTQPCWVETLETVIRHLDDEIAAWNGLDWSDAKRVRRELRRQLRRSRGRARRDCLVARRNGDDPEIWHEWRKAVKQWRYQREFAAALSGRASGPFDARISRLGTRLGERNDLANLAAIADRALRKGALSPEAHGRLTRAIVRAERAVQRSATRLGRLVFLRRPAS
ncbi:MAG: CHAD domain-containing protein [Verrucomicrobiae bacterium]|nr:CHAD domain-containing protein [Verrucomicrobiae bacterium]